MKTLVNGKAVDLQAADAHLMAIAKSAFRREIGAFVCGKTDRDGHPVCRIAQGYECICEIVVKAILDDLACDAREMLK